MFKLTFSKLTGSLFFGLLVGWLYSLSTKKSIKVLSGYLYSNLRGCPEEGQSAQTIFFLSTIRKLLFFSFAGLLSISMLKQDPFMFGFGVILSMIIFAVTNFRI